MNFLWNDIFVKRTFVKWCIPVLKSYPFLLIFVENTVHKLLLRPRSFEIETDKI